MIAQKNPVRQYEIQNISQHLIHQFYHRRKVLYMPNGDLMESFSQAEDTYLDPDQCQSYVENTEVEDDE